jgi:hypothetical protein
MYMVHYSIQLFSVCRYAAGFGVSVTSLLFKETDGLGGIAHQDLLFNAEKAYLMPLLTQEPVVGVPQLDRAPLLGPQVLQALLQSSWSGEIEMLWTKLDDFTKAAVEGMTFSFFCF